MFQTFWFDESHQVWKYSFTLLPWCSEMPPVHNFFSLTLPLLSSFRVFCQLCLNGVWFLSPVVLLNYSSHTKCLMVSLTLSYHWDFLQSCSLVCSLSGSKLNISFKARALLTSHCSRVQGLAIANNPIDVAIDKDHLGHDRYKHVTYVPLVCATELGPAVNDTNSFMGISSRTLLLIKQSMICKKKIEPSRRLRRWKWGIKREWQVIGLKLCVKSLLTLCSLSSGLNTGCTSCE